MRDLDCSFRFDGGEVLQERMFTKQDWKLFRTKLADWQEAYMGRLCREYIELLGGDDDPSEKFWQLDKRVREDKRRPGVRLQLSRTNMVYDIIALINDGVITVGDLEGFSVELKDAVNIFLEMQSRDYSDEE